MVSDVIAFLYSTPKTLLVIPVITFSPGTDSIFTRILFSPLFAGGLKEATLVLSKYTEIMS